MVKKETLEYQAYKILELWRPEKKIYSASELVDCSDKLFPLFLYLYDKVDELCKNLPKRKNGEVAFVHPVNVVFDLKKAGISDSIVFCVGLIHDYVEEIVDVYKKDNKISSDKRGVRLLDTYEQKVFKELEDDITTFCEKNNMSMEIVAKIIKPSRLLTRHKRHFYYSYIGEMFEFFDEEIKEIALQVKLADRTHNILSIECFSEQERINQCFKNLFLLNNTKKYLIEKYGSDNFLKENIPPIERLFNKCTKATYDAYLTILHLCVNKKIGHVKGIIQLAFKKFSLERKGLTDVTEVDKNEIHPLKLFQGIVLKYDARLHSEWKTFERIKKEEKEYLRLFFSDFKFTDKQLQAVVDYKDAYALKEALARLLYLPDYVVSRFLWTTLTKKGRISKKKKNSH